MILLFLQCTSNSLATLSETTAAVALRMRNLLDATDSEEKYLSKNTASCPFWLSVGLDKIIRDLRYSWKHLDTQQISTENGIYLETPTITS